MIHLGNLFFKRSPLARAILPLSPAGIGMHLGYPEKTSVVVEVIAAVDVKPDVEVADAKRPRLVVNN